MDLISIIIPYYNVEKKLLDRCINSILNQTIDDYEVIIINDGSTSHSSRQLQEYTLLDSRIMVYHQKNQGVSAARNYGGLLAKGKYIVFVDADDVMMPWYLEEAYHIAEDLNADILYGYVRRFKEALCDAVRVENPVIKQAEEDWLKKYHIGFLDKNQMGNFGRGPWARLIRAEFVKNTLFPLDVPIGEDVLWNLELMKKVKRSFVVEQVWYGYYVREESVTCKYSPNIVEKLLPFYDKIGLYIDSSDREKNYYYRRVINDLKRYVFRSYLGNSSNKDCLLKRWRQFVKVSLELPWRQIGETRFFRISDSGTKVKIVLFRAHLLFFVWSIEKAMKTVMKRT